MSAAAVAALARAARLAAERWAGVDETVVERFAAEAGRRPWHLVGASGDLQLFVFLAAGIVGGFALGYRWRQVFHEGRQRGSDPLPTRTRRAGEGR